jgi:hypothetical protein
MNNKNILKYNMQVKESFSGLSTDEISNEINKVVGNYNISAIIDDKYIRVGDFKKNTVSFIKEYFINNNPVSNVSNALKKLVGIRENGPLEQITDVLRKIKKPSKKTL